MPLPQWSLAGSREQTYSREETCSTILCSSSWWQGSSLSLVWVQQTGEGSFENLNDDGQSANVKFYMPQASATLFMFHEGAMSIKPLKIKV